MSDSYIIELRPAAAGVTLQAGIVVREGRGFRFFAASPAFDALEGRCFGSPKKAEEAALRRIAEMTARCNSVQNNAPAQRAVRETGDDPYTGAQSQKQGVSLAQTLDWNGGL
jgi:hypothetical protein